MIKTIKYYLSVGGLFLRLSLQKQFEYPLLIISCFIMIPMMYGTGILLLYFMVQNYQPLSGWAFPQLVFLYGLGDLSHGLMMIFSVQNWWIETYVLKGEFDRMLLRPMSVFFQFSVKYINFVGLMDVIVGGAIFLYGAHLVNFIWSFENLLKVTLVVIGATLIRSSIFTMACSVAFWTKRSESLFLLLNDFMERMTLYPMSMYPYSLQLILTWILPLAFISFFPASEFLNKNNIFSIPLGVSSITLILGIMLFMLANKVFNNGLKKYESAGS